MRKILLLTLILHAAVMAGAQHTTNVKLLKGEKWWGAFVSGSPVQPLTAPMRIDMSENSNPGTLYAPVLVSNMGRYVACNHPFTVDLSEEEMNIVSQYETPVVEKAGKTLREAYLVCCHKNFPPTGPFPGISFFTMPVYETRISMGHDQSQDRIVAYAGRLLSEGFPKGIIVICDGWQSTLRPWDFNRELYPDPGAMLDKLHGMGFKVILTVTPYLPAGGAPYVRALRGGELMMGKKRENAPFIFSGADGSYNAVYNDIPDGFGDLRDAYDFDGYRFDCASAAGIPTEGWMDRWMKTGEGIAMRDCVGGVEKPLGESAYGIRPAGRITETGAIRDVINNMISAGLAGYPCTHVSLPDADAFTLAADNGLAARYMIMQTMMPIATVDMEPWAVTDPGMYRELKNALELRMSLAGYLEGLVRESGRTAEPIIQHLEYRFPHNGFADCTDQFMLGPKYLIAPCVDGAPRRMVRLPKGTWTDRDGRRFKGPLLTEADCTKGLIFFELAKK